MLKLLLLLPYFAPQAEVDFHETLVLNAYQDFYQHYEATGYCDRATLKSLKEFTRYSMSVLFWCRYGVWRRVRKFHHRAWRLKHLIPLEKTSQILIKP